MDFDRIRLLFEAGERETSSSSCKLNLVFQGEHSFGRSWRLGISCEKKPVKNEPLSVRHGGEVLNGPKRPLILRSSAHPIVGDRSGGTNSMGNGVQWSAFSMAPALSASPALASDLVPISPEEEWLLECVVLSVPIVAGKGFQVLIKDSFLDCLRLSLHNVSVEALRPGGTVLRRWSFGSVESSLLSD